eukprot:197532_1
MTDIDNNKNGDKNDIDSLDDASPTESMTEELFGEMVKTRRGGSDVVFSNNSSNKLVLNRKQRSVTAGEVPLPLSSITAGGNRKVNDSNKIPTKGAIIGNNISTLNAQAMPLQTSTKGKHLQTSTEIINSIPLPSTSTKQWQNKRKIDENIVNDNNAEINYAQPQSAMTRFENSKQSKNE